MVKSASAVWEKTSDDEKQELLNIATNFRAQDEITYQDFCTRLQSIEERL
jgi:hypothetical protein